MHTAAVTAPLPATHYPEPTHRFGRALDDRLPATGTRPVPSQPASADADTGELHTASLSPATDDEGFTFNDLLDVINPLQHVPVVSTLYREFTGDEIRPESRVLGGGLFGGVIGAAGSLLDVALEAMTGDSAGGHVMTALFGDDEADTAPAQQSVEVASRQAAETPAPVTPAMVGAVPTSGPKSVVEPASAQIPPVGRAKQALPTLSPSAFDALMESFDSESQADAKPPSPGLAYAPMRNQSGVLVNEAL